MSEQGPDNSHAGMLTPQILLQPLCFVGAVLVAIGLGGGAVTFLGDLYVEQARPYQALFTFVVAPAIVLVGAMIFGLGVLMERRRRRRAVAAKVERRPALDLRRMSHRILFTFLILIGSAGTVVAIVGGLHAYEFTESIEFCGGMCHVPMGPEAIAHRDSPHAMVRCAECHVGPGGDEYVKAKLSGLRQVYHVVTDTYERPIHAPKEKIPGSQYVCEHCHWSNMDAGLVFDNRVRFGYDLGNSERSLHIMLRMRNGEGKERNGNHRGNIHWHTRIDGAVSFRALDANKQQIAQITVRDPDGTQRVYDLHEDGERKYGDAEVEALASHEIECLDCHNRPAHQFLTPDEALDRALESRAIDPSIPFIKRVAIKALATEFSDTDAALEGIRDQITEYYTDHFDGKILERRDHVDQAIEKVQAIYQRNIFPEMKINWETYPSNIGHRTSAGCFRCHAGKHVSEDGQVLDHDCSKCHIFFEKDRELESLLEAPADASFVHPFAHEKHYTEVDCWECHTGAASPYSDCGRCHEREAGSEQMGFSCSVCHRPGSPKAQVSSCGPCHPTLDSELHAHKDHGNCLDCHASHDWKVQSHERCAACHKPHELAQWGEHGSDGQCEVAARFGGVRSSMWGLVLHEKLRIESAEPGGKGGAADRGRKRARVRRQEGRPETRAE